MQRTKPATGEIYHIYNRGVEKRSIFGNDDDRKRFMVSLYVFNNQSAYPNIKRSDLFEVGLPTEDSRELLVEILAYVLMPNHYHLIVKQVVDNGISEFMQKLGTGYTNAFNTKYDRVGSLFQGKYKYVHINNHRHLLYLPYYIHLNPLDLVKPEWRDKKVKNWQKAWHFLESYPWSSHLDYTGTKNTPYSYVINKEFLNKIFDGSVGYTKGIKQWIRDCDLDALHQVTLE